MKPFRLKISSPDGDIFDGDIQILILRGAEGDLAVMAGHAPFITSVKAGECRITLADGSEKKATTDGGLLSVQNGCATLLSSSFSW